jgi:flagellar hook assembly protein FlgD
MNLQTTASIDQNYPNPFNTNTIIHFQTKKQEEINLDIYDIYGKKVKTLVNETLPAGNYYTAWKGKNNRGKQLSPGTYFLRFKVGNFISVKKMILIE